MIEEENSCWSCYDSIVKYFEENKRKFAGRLGIILSILNVIFIILDTTRPTEIGKYIVAGLVSAGVFFGGFMFERMAMENEMLNEDNKSKQEIIRRYTMAPDLERGVEITMTPQSIDSIEPINFEIMHRNNVVQSSLNNFAFPQE